jgi:molybdenum storage protein
MDKARMEFEELLTHKHLTDEELLKLAEKAEDYRILPDATVVKIGGQSIIDRGRAAVYPLVEELAAARKNHKLLIGTGAGALNAGAVLPGQPLNQAVLDAHPFVRVQLVTAAGPPIEDAGPTDEFAAIEQILRSQSPVELPAARAWADPKGGERPSHIY